MIGRKVIRWETPVIYALSVLMLSTLVAKGGTAVSNTGIWLAAFFIVTDPVTSPLTRTGERWFVLGAGILTVLFQMFTGSFWGGASSGILLMNAIVPRLDMWCRPRPMPIRL